MYATDKGTSSAVGVSGDAAGVHDDDICTGKIRSWTQSAMAQTCRDRFSVVAAGSAPKVLDMVFCHVV